MISVFLNLLRFDLWPKMQSIMENLPRALEKMYCSSLGWNVLKISMRFISSNVSFKTCVSFLIFCFEDLSIGVTRVLKSPTIIVLLSISPFMSVIICLMYWGAPVLHAKIFTIVFPLDWSLDHYVVSFFISIIFFILRSILSDMRIATTAFFCFSYSWEYIFPSSHFQSICVFRPEVGFLWIAYIWVLFLYPFSQSVSFGWSI